MYKHIYRSFTHYNEYHIRIGINDWLRNGDTLTE